MNRRVTLLYVLFQVGLIFVLISAGSGGLGLPDEPAVVGVLVCMVLGAFTILHTGVDLERLSDPTELWGLVATLLLAAFFFYFLPLADRKSWFVIIPGDEVRYTGLLLFAIGTGARTMGFLTRQEKMSATGLFPLLDERSFVERSIYLRTRHPQYLGLILQSVGFALAFRSWLGLVAALVMVGPIVARVNAEEQILRERLGERYEKYLERTWRFLPGIY
ncbi:MAG TPA: isoprenylcysteine carboxylmethyltransferase family protein [Firmicutes bacterium]|nr:isoprenylcysteine carboxylmethyltransferase family protein [Bacillota bacterium]